MTAVLWALVAVAFWLLTALHLRIGDPTVTYYPPRFTWIEALLWPLGSLQVLRLGLIWVAATIEHQVWRRIVMQLLRIPAYARFWISRVPSGANLHRPEFAVQILSTPRLIRKWKRRKVVFNHMISVLRRDSRRRQAQFAEEEA